MFQSRHAPAVLAALALCLAVASPLAATVFHPVNEVAVARFLNSLAGLEPAAPVEMLRTIAPMATPPIVAPVIRPASCTTCAEAARECGKICVAPRRGTCGANFECDPANPCDYICNCIPC